MLGAGQLLKYNSPWVLRAHTGPSKIRDSEVEMVYSTRTLKIGYCAAPLPVIDIVPVADLFSSTKHTCCICFFLFFFTISQRQRNRDNMRKFRKPKAVGRFKKPSDATATKRAAAKAAETEFVAKVRIGTGRGRERKLLSIKFLIGATAN